MRRWESAACTIQVRQVMWKIKPKNPFFLSFNSRPTFKCSDLETLFMSLFSRRHEVSEPRFHLGFSYVFFSPLHGIYSATSYSHVLGTLHAAGRSVHLRMWIRPASGCRRGVCVALVHAIPYIVLLASSSHHVLNAFGRLLRKQKQLFSTGPPDRQIAREVMSRVRRARSTLQYLIFVIVLLLLLGASFELLFQLQRSQLFLLTLVTVRTQRHQLVDLLVPPLLDCFSSPFCLLQNTRNDTGSWIRTTVMSTESHKNKQYAYLLAFLSLPGIGAL